MTTPADPPSAADRAFATFRRTGDADALGAVYDELAPGLLRLAVKLLGDAGAAEDVLQATFVTAIQSAARHDGERPVAPWLAGILANEVRAHRRRTSRAVDPVRLAPRGAPSDPSQDAIDAELDAVVGRHIRELPETWQEPVLLRVRQGLTVPEIAAALDRPAGTIRGQIARGLARLRAGLVSALGALGLARVIQRTEWEGGGRLSAVAKSVGVVGGTTMVASLVIVVWGIVSVAGSEPGAVTEGGASASPPVVVAEGPEPASVAPLVAGAPAPEPLVVEPPVGARGGDDERSVDVRIVVIDEGQRVGHATIDVYASRDDYDGYAPPLRSETADGAGGWSGELAPGEAFVARTDTTRLGLLVTFEQTTSIDRVVELSAIATIAGRVVDVEGDAVPGCEVRVWSVGGGSIDGLPRKVPQGVTSDARGRFAVDVDPAHYALRARAGERWSLTVDVDTDDLPDDLTLVIPGDWRVAGRVVDARGEPVAAHVRVYPDASLGFEASMAPGVKRAIRSADCDEDGRFELRVPELATYRVVAEAEGHAPSALVDVLVSDETPIAQVELALHDTVSIRGRVVDVDGDPIADAWVSAGSGAGPGGWMTGDVLAPRHDELFGHASTTTDPRGAFVLDGLSPLGRYTLTVSVGSSSGRASLAHPEPVPGGTDDVVIVDRGLLRTTSITGRVVVDATDEPLRHFSLRITRERGNIHTTSTHDVDDPEGRFAVDGLDVRGVFGISVVPIEVERETLPSGQQLTVERRDLARVDLPFGRLDPAGETYEIRVPATGRLEVLLLDEAGAPRPFARLRLKARGRLRTTGTWTGTQRADEAGRAIAPSLRPGVYDASIDGVSYGVVEITPGETIAVTLSPVDDD